eukprot:1159661-Pelagomonas_calceolata.AAC.1
MLQLTQLQAVYAGAEVWDGWEDSNCGGRFEGVPYDCFCFLACAERQKDEGEGPRSVLSGQVVGEKVQLQVEASKGGKAETMEADVVLVSIGESWAGGTSGGQGTSELDG